MLEISQNASQHLAELLASRGKKGLRLTVKRGGCAGLEYVMTVDSPQADDYVFECSGGCVFIGRDSLAYLEGSTLDYEDGLKDCGFRIRNPRAARSCGCGTSFELNS